MESLIDKIGADGLKEIVELFYGKVFDNPVIGHLFQNDKQEIMVKQYAFLTQFLGGPQLYTERFGQPKMRARHMPHKITSEAKDVWLRLMKEAINESSIQEEIKEPLYNCFPKVAEHMVNS
jgi:hemoglobin